MRFHGLFIGIDRYQSPGIGYLTSAVQDATALRALFADGFASDPVLLTDAEATQAAIRAQLDRLIAESVEDDLVVITFSGHGSPTHELVPYDGELTRLGETALPLEELAAVINKISAATVLCVLDCCFSGGYDAKVVLPPVLARGMESELTALQQIAGQGRIVFTASGPNESAYEERTLGHGFLTYYLLAALQGEPEVVTNGKIDLYKLLNHVTRRVTDSSAALRRDQHPSVRGSVDGIVSWPILCPGPRYSAAFPHRVRQPANASVHSLESFGLPPALLDTWAQTIPGLNGLQLAAINDYGLLDGDNVLVTAPTSSGKTMIGELAALHRISQRQRAMFLLPMRALVNDKYVEFTRKYQALGIETIRSSGEISDDNAALMNGRYDICLMTYEKFRAMALASPHLLRQIGTLVVDEVQMIVDVNRGENLELVLTLINARRAEGIVPQVICLSAVIGDTGGLERWLGGRHLRHEARPVPLIEGVVSRAGHYQHVNEHGRKLDMPLFTPQWSGKESSQDLIIPLVTKLVAEGKQVIVFRETKGETAGCAGYLADRLGLAAVHPVLDALPTGDLSTASQRLRRVLAHGVAFHNSDLTRDERHHIETAFREPGTSLRVLVATTTLAMGVNTPASAVVIAGLTHPGGAAYTVAEYKNMAGRAGRLGFSERGESYLLAGRGLDDHTAWNGYVLGSPEAVNSVLFRPGADRRSQVLSALAALQSGPGSSVPAELLISFLENSFGAFQQRLRVPDWVWGRDSISAILRDFERHQLVELGADDTYRLTELGRFAGEGGVSVDSIVRLVELLRPLTGTPNSATLIAAAQVTTEVDAVPMAFNRRAKNTEHVRWVRALANQIPGSVLNRLGIGGESHLTGRIRAKKAVACLMYASNMPLPTVEQHLTQHVLGDSIAGAVRSVADRTRDMIPTVVRVFEFLRSDTSVDELAARTMVRLELGVPAESAELGALLGTELSRAQYLSLLAQGFASPTQFDGATAQQLASCLGTSVSHAAELQGTANDRRHQRSDGNAEPLLPPPAE